MKFLKELEENLMLFFMAVVTVFILAGWVLNFVDKEQMAAANEIAIYAYTWFTFLAFGLSAKKGLFTKIDVLTSNYPAGLQKKLDIAIDVILFLLSVMFLVLGAQSFYLKLISGELNAKVGIPVAIVYLAPVVGFALASIRYIQLALTGSKKEGK